ncbi:ABC transporter permease [Sediminispirochaeta smaragdinae]|uniref:Binding-protein-dependent transport systems inner membrane component n=1 Tax=Sediminispirochaeta smaragdinae (strain DSM 11293 / JCM 15392 / SEBR 4228) TaxID=573413 RepID=E1R6F4_SEDSS|nr:iron ABC transporter permease [Sediminispirochaeta smaragdinae]ADK80972.1 binding-protein-dependent transport systems inner membrane component [Sediminispirochaeta smaragdinae DSM 11293]
MRNGTNDLMWKMKMILKEPILIIFILLLLLLLTVFVFYPLLMLIKYSITADGGELSLQTIWAVVKNSSYRIIFSNSIKLGLISACIATIIGYIFAFAITRTELPMKGFMKTMATLPIVSPPFVLSLSIIFLFGRKGLITNGLLGITDFNVYGMHSLILVQTISFFPVAYLTLSGILQAIDSSVEDAALNLGASRWKIFWTVTFPLSLPGIFSAFLLVFIQSLQDFSNPAVIGGGFPTLGVEAYRVITGMYDLRTGAILSIMLLIPSLMAFLLQRYWISGKGFVTVTGKPSQNRTKLNQRHIVIPLFAVCLLFCAVIVLFYGTVIVGAFVKVWGVNYSFTLDHFRYVFSIGFKPLRNAVTLAIIATPITGLTGMAIAFLTVRKSFFGKRYMSLASLLTFALPGTVVGISYILAFNDRPFLLTGTAVILICVFVFRNLPVGIEGASSALMQIDPSIEEASINMGAGSFYTFFHITLPLIRGAFFSGLVYSFVRAMTAVSAIIFLVSARWNVVTTRIFSLFEVSQYSDAAAYIVIMIIVIACAIYVLNFLVSKMDPEKNAMVRK